MLSPKRLKFILPLFVVTLSSLYVHAQENPAALDPVPLIGMTLEELIARFGVPRSVHPSRGLEEWQDDVVFVYGAGDFYVYKDRVWQAGLKAAKGIKTGDSRAVVSLVLGPKAESRGSSLFLALNEGAWPLMLRCDFDREDKVLAVFIYRTDF